MKNSIIFTALLAAVSARPVANKREVPQEHSHEQFLRTVNTFLKQDNPDGIVDAVFGLLGNAAATNGLGQISDPDCLQQATADQAFTNAKAAGDVDGMTSALIFRALERNTGAVGQASVACTAIQAVNPEIAAITQHQDPASDNAASVNKAITLELAKQIASVGGDPQLALKAGTFAPGQIGDPTGAGNTCDDADDAVGCIFTQNLIVEDATAAEIDAAVQGVAAGGNAGNAGNSTSNAGNNNNNSNSANTGNAACSSSSSSSSSSSASTSSNSTSSTGGATSSASATGAANVAGADFGKCANAGIVFGAGFDGRKDESFQPADLSTFNHGSALGIGVITGFIVSRIQDTGACGTNDAAIAAVQAAETAAKAQTGQAAADAWNQALGL